MPFKAKIHAVEIEDGGEVATFYIREASGREVLTQMERVQRETREKKTPTPEQNARQNFKYVVHDDGSPLAEIEIEELLDMRLSALTKLNDLIMEKSGIGKAAATTKVEDEKKD